MQQQGKMFAASINVFVGLTRERVSDELYRGEIIDIYRFFIHAGLSIAYRIDNILFGVNLKFILLLIY